MSDWYSATARYWELIDSRPFSVIVKLLPICWTSSAFRRGLCICTSHLVWTGPFGPLKLFRSFAFRILRPAIHPLRPHFPRDDFLYFILLQLSFLTSNSSSHQHTLRIRISDGITPSPLFPPSPSPFFFPTCKAAMEQGVQIMLAFVLFSHKYISHDGRIHRSVSEVSPPHDHMRTDNSSVLGRDSR